MKDRYSIQKNYLDYGKIVLGTGMMAVAVNLIYEPLGMVTGGVSGFSILVKRITAAWFSGGIPVGVTNFVLNIPIFLVAARVKGKKFVCKTFFANICFTLSLIFIPVFPIEERDYFLATVTGGVLTGAGLGMVFSTNTSTGGTDLLSTVIHEWLSYLSVARILMVIDSLIVILGAVYFGIRPAVYATIAVVISSRVMDSILEGVKFAKILYVISEQYEQIGEYFMTHLERGVTILDVEGMYSEEKRKMLYCVTGRKEISRFITAVERFDSNAFVTVVDAREVLGEGFIQNRQ